MGLLGSDNEGGLYRLRKLLGRAKRSCLRKLNWVIEIKASHFFAAPVSAVDRELCVRQFCEVVPITEVWEGCFLDESATVERLRSGHLLFGIIKDEVLVTYGWVSGPGQRVRVLHDMFFSVPDNSIYIWDILTVQAERNKGYASVWSRGILRYFEEIKTRYVAIDITNKPSIRVHEKVGYRKLFPYFGVKLFGKAVLGLAVWEGRLVKGTKAFDRITDHGTSHLFGS